MGTEREFPYIVPSSRSYKPGKQVQSKFRSLDGSTTFMQYGYLFTDAELKLQFKNIPDDDAALILQHYEDVQGDDWVAFSRNNQGQAGGWYGISKELFLVVKGGDTHLRWRYTNPPQITSIYPGVSTVSCEFTGYLYGV